MSTLGRKRKNKAFRPLQMYPVRQIKMNITIYTIYICFYVLMEYASLYESRIGHIAFGIEKPSKSIKYNKELFDVVF